MKINGRPIAISLAILNKRLSYRWQNARRV